MCAVQTHQSSRGRRRAWKRGGREGGREVRERHTYCYVCVCVCVRQAVLGGKVSVPTLDGEEEIALSPGVCARERESDISLFQSYNTRRDESERESD